MNNRKPKYNGKKKRTFIPKPNHLGGDVRVTVSSNTPPHIKAALERNMVRYNNPKKMEVK